MPVPPQVIGAFADIGGVITTISIEWMPPPEEVAADLVKVAGYLENLGPPLRASKAIAKADIQHHFDTETDPNGKKWQALDPDYLAAKLGAGYPPDILHRGGDLESAATSEAAFQVTGDSLFYDAGGLPDYGLIHQAGTGPGGSRALGLEMHRADAKSRGMISTLGSHASQRIGRGMDLPARQFIGISAEAEEQIFGVFDLWFAEGISIAVSGSGAIQSRLPSGRFGGKINLA